MTTIRGVRIRGQLLAEEDLSIDGDVEGTIDLRGHLTVLGRFEGSIQADAVDIGPDARVQANVLTKQLALAEGAQFNGSVNTERARAAIEVARRRAAATATR
ncbi:MAG TPA: polymer-forming cytoskeletal protein [Gemmatimonadaceae bacterium]|nr:polymer-forming cytoskeletal protein [Gemmatimonadaceae bacterium]